MNLDDLERLAKAAMPGRPLENVAYIAAWSPDVALRFVALARAAKDLGYRQGAMAELRAALAALEDKPRRWKE
jgi:hypothetical protein